MLEQRLGEQREEQLTGEVEGGAGQEDVEAESSYGNNL